ncbi:hypothetical protein F66182_5417 [Fusarium sp. NRRL 66182]|nr:hypothetical protein F66182_5417 [Fusarium sp. NRRL 66182]
MKSTTALLAIAALAKASPVSKRQEPWDSKETLCKGWDLRTPEGVEKLWEDSAAGVQLDLFIKAQWEHENNWVKNVEDQVMKGTSGKSGAAGCAVLGSECNPMNGLSCEDQFDQHGQDGGAIGKNSYWIFQAVKGMHAKFNELNRQLTEETLISGLKIDQMVSDFQGNQDDPSNVFAWLAAASTMGNAIGGLVPGAGSGIAAGFGLLGGIFSGLAGEVGPDEIDTGSIASALADVFEAASNKLEGILRIATGGGTSPEEYGSLPAPKWDTYESSIAKFFNGGWFLIDDDAEAVRLAISSISNNIKSKVANDVMKAANLRLVADRRDNVKTREECGYAPGRQWMALRDGEEYCFYIMRYNANSINVENVGDDIYEKMASYGLGNREQYYRAVLDCALSDAGDVDVNNMGWGEIPTCYFNLPAIFVNEPPEHGCSISMAGCQRPSISDIE